MTKDDRFLFSLDFGGYVKLWDLRKGEVMHTIGTRTINNKFFAGAINVDSNDKQLGIWSERSVMNIDVQQLVTIHARGGHVDLVDKEQRDDAMSDTGVVISHLTDGIQVPDFMSVNTVEFFGEDDQWMGLGNATFLCAKTGRVLGDEWKDDEDAPVSMRSLRVGPQSGTIVQSKCRQTWVDQYACM
eukprot:TRINITY_DN2815_c0_g1_i1.p1 TRINITY_DN2815_c0_g1~~TRINITY_DN2815_c0_g1_i1.p1  ORF type:complete len:186 (-),score=43.79 TRINITY_DN2815_c0_g1_i1:717-1274(-)